MSDYETLQKKRNVTVGIFVLIAACALVWLIFQFGKLPSIVSAVKSYTIKIQFPTASGVQQNTPVRFCGYQVGKVYAVKPPQLLTDLATGKTYYQAIVIAHIEKQFNDIPTNVQAKLLTRGLGSSFIELSPIRDANGLSKAVLQENSVLQGSTGISNEFFPEETQKKLETLADNLTVLIANTNKIIGDPNNRDNIRASLKNISELTAQAGSTMSEAENLFISSRAATEELSKTLSEMRLILEKINSGKGSMAKLLNDGSLYEALLEDAEHLRNLTDELKKAVTEYREKGFKIKLK